VVDRLKVYPAVIAAAAGLAAVVRDANTILGVSQPSVIASDGIAVMIELIAVGSALAMIGRLRGERLAAEAAEAAHPHEAESRLPWIIAALLAWLTLAASLAALLTGYIEMAAKLMGELVWIAIVAASMFLLVRFVDDLFPAILSRDGALGRFLHVAIGLSQEVLEQFSVLLSGLFRLTLILFGWAAILAPFGAGAGDVFSRVTSSQLVLRIGQASISPGAVMGAAAVFLVGLAITKAIRGWVEKRYLPKTRIDIGLRTSLASGVTYLGAGLAILFTFSYLGLSFDKIALFASALSVGIGFGLQSVIGNFVSGLILLAERPIKVGDWIAIGDLEGDVKRINVRATEIEMQDRSKLIVPNSDLISKTVRNVTHSAAIGRLKIVIKTDDSADPVVVRNLILARLTGHPDVLQEPAAAVYLSDVRDGALEFTSFAFVSSPRLAYRTRSDILFQIVPDLMAKGIALANSTPVVNVGLADRPIEPAPETPAP
jgi:small-conductance mechanosensitive channel